jgi:hypothetical protein
MKVAIIVSGSILCLWHEAIRRNWEKTLSHGASVAEQDNILKAKSPTKLYLKLYESTSRKNSTSPILFNDSMNMKLSV